MFASFTDEGIHNLSGFIVESFPNCECDICNSNCINYEVDTSFLKALTKMNLTEHQNEMNIYLDVSKKSTLVHASELEKKKTPFT